MSKKKRKSGSNKGRRKQRLYQQHVRANLAAGLANMATGNWVPASAIPDGKVRQRAENVSSRMGA